jgi:hypothetical protein
MAAAQGGEASARANAGTAASALNDGFIEILSAWTAGGSFSNMAARRVDCGRSSCVSRDLAHEHASVPEFCRIGHDFKRAQRPMPALV